MGTKSLRLASDSLEVSKKGNSESEIPNSGNLWVQSIITDSKLPVLTDSPELEAPTTSTKSQPPAIPITPTQSNLNTSLADLESFLDKVFLLQTATSFTYSEMLDNIDDFMSKFAKYLEDLTTRDEQEALARINEKFGSHLSSIKVEDVAKLFFDIQGTTYNKEMFLNLKEKIDGTISKQEIMPLDLIEQDIEGIQSSLEKSKSDPLAGKNILYFSKLIEDEWHISLDQLTDQWLADKLSGKLDQQTITDSDSILISKVISPDILEESSNYAWRDLDWFITTMQKVWNRHSRTLKRDMRLLELDFEKRYEARIKTNPTDANHIAYLLNAQLGITPDDLGENLVYARLTKDARASITNLNPFKGFSKSIILSSFFSISPVILSFIIFGIILLGGFDWLLRIQKPIGIIWPETYTICSVIGIGIVIVFYTIKPLRFVPKWIYTAVHELGHSIFSFLAGQGFQRIRLNGIHDMIRTGAHGSSEVVKPRGWSVPGIVVMSLAGYVFPVQLGIWLLLAVLFHLTLGVQITLFAIPILILLFGRNLGALYFSLIFGVMSITTIILTANTYPDIIALLGSFMLSVLLFEGIRSLSEVAIIQYAPNQSGSDDLGNLSKQFIIKGKVWLFIMIISLSIMILGTGLLIRLLMPHI